MTRLAGLAQGGARGAFALGLVVVVLLSLIPIDRVPFETGLSDKLDHVIAYAGLAACGLVGFRGRRAALLLALGLVALGAGLEVLQSWVPGRMPSGLDALANTLGVTVGGAGARLAEWAILTRAGGAGRT